MSLPLLLKGKSYNAYLRCTYTNTICFQTLCREFELLNIICCYMYLHYHLNTWLVKKLFWKTQQEWKNVASQRTLKYTSQACSYQELTSQTESWKSYSFANLTMQKRQWCDLLTNQEDSDKYRCLEALSKGYLRHWGNEVKFKTPIYFT